MRESCIVACVTLFKAELNLFAPDVHLTFHSSRPDNYTVIQGPTSGPDWLDPYIIGHYRLEVANDVFNDMGTSGLIVLSHRCTRSAAWRRAIRSPGTIAVSGEWSTVLALHCAL
jgi:hypothetical protein